MDFLLKKFALNYCLVKLFRFLWAPRMKLTFSDYEISDANDGKNFQRQPDWRASLACKTFAINYQDLDFTDEECLSSLSKYCGRSHFALLSPQIPRNQGCLKYAGPLPTWKAKPNSWYAFYLSLKSAGQGLI